MAATSEKPTYKDAWATCRKCGLWTDDFYRIQTGPLVGRRTSPDCRSCLLADRTRARRKGRSGVYFIRAAGLTKVGWTRDFARRFPVFRTHSPVPIELVHFIDGVPKSVEYEFHRVLGVFRDHGEWFRLTDPFLQGLAGIEGVE